MSQRRTSGELRELLIQAGLRVLYRRGLRATASHVPMTAATEELRNTHGIEIGMGSIFGDGRLWANVGEFQIELLRAAIEDHSAGGPNDRSLALIHQYLDDLRDQPLEQRMATMIDLCRLAGTMNGYVRPSGDKGRTWDLWVGIWAIAMTADDAAEALIPALREEVGRTSRSFMAVYAVMLEKLGLRVRCPYSNEHLAILAAAVTDGMALRTAIDPRLAVPIEAPDGGTSWNLLGLGLAAIVTELLEDDTRE